MLRFIAFVWDHRERGPAEAAHALMEPLTHLEAVCAGGKRFGDGFSSVTMRSSDIGWPPLGMTLSTKSVGNAPSEWKSALTLDGLAVFHTDTPHGPAGPHPLFNSQGVVLGQIFARSCAEHVQRKCTTPLSSDPTVVASRGRKLIERYWGRYVAFLTDSETGCTLILRDPSGALPCFYTRAEGVTVLFSSPEDCIPLGLRFSVNWSYVAAHLLSEGWLECEETGLNEVAAVLAGECIEIASGSVRRQFYWDPRRIATESKLEETQTAVECLRRETRTCIQAWASDYDCVLHRLSGGLDSAIVLSCLRAASPRPKVVCLNYHSPGSNTDERTFARLAAQAAQCELIEQERDPCVRLERLLEIRRSARPATYWYSLHHSHIETQIARQVGAGAITSGEIGDGLFYFSPALPAAADYLATRGLGIGFLKTVLDVAYVEGVSIWRVLRMALSHRLVSKLRCDPRESVLPFRGVVPQAIRDREMRSERFMHPWLKTPADVPSGKQWHIHMMSVAFALHPCYDPLGRPGDPDPLPPLLSQPLIELCLRIPTWLHLKGGWDRAIARRAFRDEIPMEIITRRTKGGQEEFIDEVLRRNIHFVRELLLEGALVREGLLDRKALEEALSLRPTAVRSLRSELYFYISTEAWLRSWLDPMQPRNP